MAEVATKEKKAPVKKRTVAEIAAIGNKGLVILTAQHAFRMSENQDKPFKGSNLSEYESEASAKGACYNITAKDGKIMSLETNSDTYKKVEDLARKAFEDVKADKMTPAVNAFINALLELKGSGTGQRTGAILKGFSFK